MSFGLERKFEDFFTFRPDMPLRAYEASIDSIPIIRSGGVKLGRAPGCCGPKKSYLPVPKLIRDATEKSIAKITV